MGRKRDKDYGYRSAILVPVARERLVQALRERDVDVVDGHWTTTLLNHMESHRGIADMNCPACGMTLVLEQLAIYEEGLASDLFRQALVPGVTTVPLMASEQLTQPITQRRKADLLRDECQATLKDYGLTWTQVRYLLPLDAEPASRKRSSQEKHNEYVARSLQWVLEGLR